MDVVICCSPRISKSSFLSKLKVFMEVLPKINDKKLAHSGLLHCVISLVEKSKVVSCLACSHAHHTVIF